MRLKNILIVVKDIEEINNLIPVLSNSSMDEVKLFIKSYLH